MAIRWRASPGVGHPGPVPHGTAPRRTEPARPGSLGADARDPLGAGVSRWFGRRRAPARIGPRAERSCTGANQRRTLGFARRRAPGPIDGESQVRSAPESRVRSARGLGFGRRRAPGPPGASARRLTPDPGVQTDPRPGVGGELSNLSGFSPEPTIPRPDAPRPSPDRTTRSVGGGIPTRSVGTRATPSKPVSCRRGPVGFSEKSQKFGELSDGEAYRRAWVILPRRSPRTVRR